MTLLISAEEKGPDPELVTPGVGGFLVIFILSLATIVLVRSMTKHLRNVRYSPDPSAEPDAAATPDPAAGAGLEKAPDEQDQAEEHRS